MQIVSSKIAKLVAFLTKNARAAFEFGNVFFPLPAFYYILPARALNVCVYFFNSFPSNPNKPSLYFFTIVITRYLFFLSLNPLIYQRNRNLQQETTICRVTYYNHQLLITN